MLSKGPPYARVKLRVLAFNYHIIMGGLLPVSKARNEPQRVGMLRLDFPSSYAVSMSDIQSLYQDNQAFPRDSLGVSTDTGQQCSPRD